MSLNRYEVQAVFVGEGMPPLNCHVIASYGCVRCQKWHAEDEPLFEQHVMSQSKTPWRDTPRVVWFTADALSWKSWLDSLRVIR